MMDNIPMDMGLDRSYSCSLRALTAFHGKNYPRWYSSAVAGFHTNFYYYEGEEGFAYSFCTPEKVLAGITKALDWLGFENKFVKGLDWLESWEVLKTASEQKTPVMIGPVNAELLSRSGKGFDYYAIVAGVTSKEVVLKEPVGMNNSRIPVDEFRAAWKEKTLFSKEAFSNPMVIVKRRTAPKSEERTLCSQALKELAKDYYTQNKKEAEHGTVFSGRKALEELAGMISGGSKKTVINNLRESLEWNRNAGNVTRYENSLFIGYARKFWDTEEMKELNRTASALSEAWLKAEQALERIVKGDKKARGEAAHALEEVMEKEDAVKEKLLKITSGL